jgi:hypothetical protein
MSYVISNILKPWTRRRRRRAGSVGAAAGRSAKQRSQPGQSSRQSDFKRGMGHVVFVSFIF